MTRKSKPNALLPAVVAAVGGGSTIVAVAAGDGLKMMVAEVGGVEDVLELLQVEELVQDVVDLPDAGALAEEVLLHHLHHSNVL